VSAPVSNEAAPGGLACPRKAEAGAGFNAGAAIIMARTSPAQFVREVRQEMAKVTWPTRKELLVTTASVFVMAIAAAIFFFLVDQVIAWVVQLILGIGS
jgi:preprotein translocase subunit SecE